MSKSDRREPRGRRQFTVEFKANVVRLVLDEGKKPTQVARELDLPASCVTNWVRQARIDRGKGSEAELTSDEKKELARLRKENRELRMEREILKKAAAFFAKEST